MPTTPARKTTTARKQPQDRRPKGAVLAGNDNGEQDDLGPVRAELEGNVWRFTVDDGETWHESVALTEVFTPRWARLNRRRDNLDAIYTAVEDSYAGNDDALDAWDSLTFEEQARLGDDLFQAMGTSLGE